ncbi:MAG: endonuclease/exonuclease/phosphatase family protein [Acidimicrobiales bacterium]
MSSSIDRRPSPEGTLRILTLNIGSLFEPDWDARRHEIVAWIDRLDPDVITLQEVQESEGTPNTAGWLADAAEASWHWAFGGEGFDDGIWPDTSMRFGSAVLSRWPIESTSYHRLGVADGADRIVAGIPWELFGARTQGIDVFSTHLAPAPTHGAHRQRQVVEIDRLIRSARGTLDDLVPGRPRTGLPPILCGDFNAEAGSDEIRFLSGFTLLDGVTTAFQDAWAVAGNGGAGFTNDWTINPYAAALNVHRKRIDYVFVGDPFMRSGGAGRVLACAVVADAPLTGIVASDHAGLVADIAWPDRPA